MGFDLATANCMTKAGPEFADANQMSLHSDEELVFIKGMHTFYSWEICLALGIQT